MKTYQVTTHNPNTDETKTSEFEADMVRNEGAQTVFYSEQSIVGMVRTDHVISFSII